MPDGAYRSLTGHTRRRQTLGLTGGTIRTLETIGVAEEINEPDEPGAVMRYDAVHPKLMAMDIQPQRSEMRRLGASPDYAVGGAHAVTEQGEVFIASASGSQLTTYVYGAGTVIWVVGSQKIVSDREAPLTRNYEYSFPLEDQRGREAYGISSGVNKVLIVNREVIPDRITVILVKQELGY